VVSVYRDTFHHSALHFTHKVNRRHGHIVRVGQLPDVAGVRHAARKVEAAGRVKLVLGNALRVAHKSWGRVLETDELDHLVGSDAGLVGEREALGEELDEAKLEGVSDEPAS